MLKMRNVLQTKINKKGFTLAELLVVVAIIAVLVAVSIPIFTAKLDKAKKSTDLANLRAAKAVAASEVLDEDSKSTGGFYDIEEGTIVTTAPAGYNKAEQKGIDADKAVIQVQITRGTDTTKGSITATWVPAKTQ